MRQKASFIVSMWLLSFGAGMLIWSCGPDWTGDASPQPSLLENAGPTATHPAATPRVLAQQDLVATEGAIYRATTIAFQTARVERLAQIDTPTPMPSATSAPTMPPAPEPPWITQLLNPEPPRFGAAAYQFRSLSRDDLLDLSRLALDGKFYSDDQWLSLELLVKYSMVFRSEYLLKYPEATDWTDQALESIGYAPNGIKVSTAHLSQKSFAYLLEQSLNTGDVELANLETWLENHGIRVNGTTPVYNLFGDGRDVLLFTVETGVGVLRSQGIFAVTGLGDVFSVPVVLDWYPVLFDNFSTEPAGDNNGNGFPELAIVLDSVASGIPSPCAQYLWLYEWSKEAAEFSVLADRLTMFRQDRSIGPCRGNWRVYESAEKNQQVLQLTEYKYSQDDCQPVEIQHVYHDTGRQYEFVADYYIPPPDGRPHCQVAWADTVINLDEEGYANDVAIGILDEALEDWPEEMDANWGPASQDYFRLRLGIWFDIRGEEERSIELLQPLFASQAVTGQYDLPSRLAGAYLEGRGKAGILGACLQAERLWQTEREIVRPMGYGETDLDEVRRTWGFASDRWEYWPGSLCEVEVAISADSIRQSLNNKTELAGWFENADVNWITIQQGDLDGNGLEDWLALIERPGLFKTYQLWSFLRGTDGAQAGFVYDIYPNDQSIAGMSWTMYLPAPDGPRTHVILVDNELIIFQSLEGECCQVVERVFGTEAYRLDELQGEKILTVFRRFRTREEILSLRWNPLDQVFIQQSSTYDFEGAIMSAEQLLFNQSDFSAVAEEIERILAEAPAEPPGISNCSQDGTCESNPPWFQPYLRYLLGLAFEMRQDYEQARVAYYRLWRDYPTHILGMVASIKLELSEN